MSIHGRELLPSSRDLLLVRDDLGEILHQDESAVDSSDISMSISYQARITDIAQQIHAEQYLRLGFIAQDDVDARGRYIDAYSPRSTYILSKSGEKRTTCRLIRCNNDGLLSLPTAEHFSIQADALREVAGVEYISDLDPTDVVEMSGLASEGRTGKDAQSLNSVWLGYSRAARISIEEGHKVWMMNAEPTLIRQLRMLLGPDSIRQIGEEREYMGPPTIPVALNPQRVIRSLLEDESPRSDKKKELIRMAFEGISDENLDPDLAELMRDSGIAINECETHEKKALNKRMLATAAIFAYSLARAFPAASVDGFQGNTAALWGIDVATAGPYSWGLMEAMSGSRAAHRAAGATVAAGSFIAPYAYFWHEGNDYPPYVPIVLCGMIGAVAAKEVLQSKRRTKRSEERDVKEKELEASLLSTD